VPWTKIPWRLLVDHAPILVEAARRLYASSRPGPLRGAPGERTTLDALARAVEQLEARDAQHAELFAELAKQVQDMTTALEVLRARLRWAWLGVALALIVSLLTALLLRR
jgi:hypothetical protein